GATEHGVFIDGSSVGYGALVLPCRHSERGAGLCAGHGSGQFDRRLHDDRERRAVPSGGPGITAPWRARAVVAPAGSTPGWPRPRIPGRTRTMTESIDNYLKAIYELEEAGGRVATNALAERLRIASPSVTAMLKRLD